MRNLRLLAVFLAAVSLAFTQFPAAVSLSASASSIVCGGQLQISILVQDRSNNVITNAPVSWSSSDRTIASVDSTGIVTALLPGIVTIGASANGILGSIQLQIVPLRIDVTPANQQLHIGDQVQYSAAVLDINRQPLPVAVTWELAGANGFNTSEASLTNKGLLLAYASSSLTIRAVIRYPASSSSVFVNRFVGTTTATILPPGDYNLRRLLTTGDTRQSFRLLARRGGISVNDTEQLATVAALDGLSDGVLLADQSGYQILASGGTATLNPGGNLIDFEDPVINNRGNVLVRADAMGNSGGLLLLSKNQFQYLLTDGTTSTYANIQGATLSHYSLNDDGVVMFRASYWPAGTTTPAGGLFHIIRGAVSLDVSTAGTALPGLGSAFSIDNEYGMDSQANVYFSATDTSNPPKRGVYRLGSDGAISKALLTGDKLGAYTVSAIYGLGIGYSGDLAVGGNRSNGSQFLLRFPGGDIASKPDVLSANFGQIYAVNAAGVLFLGDAGQGWGLYLWPPAASSANMVLLQSRPAPGGDVVLEIQGAAMTSAGVVFAKVRTAAQPLEILRIAPDAAVVLFQSGDRLPVSANLTIRGLVAGAASGDAHPLLGGYQSSIFQIAGAAGLVPRVLLGDRLASAPYYGNSVVKSPNGTLYVAADDGLFRVGPSSTDLLIGLPHLDPDGVTDYGPYAISANDQGAVALIFGTNQNHSRLCILSGGKIQTLAYVGGNPQYRTASPAGGYFANYQDFAIDGNGRVVARFIVNGGPSGYFLWSKGQWKAAALFGQTKLLDQTVDSASEVKATATDFYATFVQHNVTSVLAHYTDNGWNPVFSAGQALPSGAALQSFRNFALNRAGDIAFSANADGGFPEIVVLTGGTPRLAFTGDQPLPDGSFLYNVVQIDFRDDHRVFFVAFDFSDLVNLYVAEPQF